jgi:hypothetical protein
MVGVTMRPNGDLTGTLADFPVTRPRQLTLHHPALILDDLSDKANGCRHLQRGPTKSIA